MDGSGEERWGAEMASATQRRGNRTANEQPMQYFLLCTKGSTHLVLVLDQETLPGFYSLPRAKGSCLEVILSHRS